MAQRDPTTPVSLAAGRTPTVLLTRMTADNVALKTRLSARDWLVVELPTALLQSEPLPPQATASQPLTRAHALAFTSPHAVRFFFSQFRSGPAAVVAWQARGGVIGAVGQATLRELSALALTPDVLASPARGAALARALTGQLSLNVRAGASTAVRSEPPRIVHPCAAHARPELREGLEAAGLSYEAWVCYANSSPRPPTAERQAAVAGVDVVYLAAPSAADRLLTWVPTLRQAALVCIGPTTAAHLLAHHGVQAIAVAQDPSLPSVEAAIIAAIHAVDSVP